jgi:2,4-dienoyl-CoA reductase-like NADH-dependent reductase (Old Yellow Enzyme family)
MSAPALSSPLTLPCGQVLPNRLMKAALSETLATRDGAPDHRLNRLYSTWAGGGYGLLITGNVMVDSRQIGEPGNVIAQDKTHLDALAQWAHSVTSRGVRMWMQINHPGRQANLMNVRQRPVAPSPIALDLPGATRPRELTEADIADLIQRFATTASVAEAAGFDGVQVHGAHGYLISQFLSPLTNQRTDAWGGSPERRRRFVIEVVRRIREQVSPHFAVAIKLNSADFQRGGLSEDESRSVIEALSAEAIDLIEVSGGSYESPAMMGAAHSTVAREAYFLEYAAAARAAAGDVRLAVTGGFRSPSAMQRALTSGDCDVIGLGRPTITTPASGHAISQGQTLTAHRLGFMAGGRLRDNQRVRAINSALDLGWHEDQMALIARGEQPNLQRGLLRTAGSLVRRNGRGAFSRRR